MDTKIESVNAAAAGSDGCSHVWQVAEIINGGMFGPIQQIRCVKCGEKDFTFMAPEVTLNLPHDKPSGA